MKILRYSLLLLALLIGGRFAYAQGEGDDPVPGGDPSYAPQGMTRATIHGTVTRVEGERAYVRTNGGREIPVNLGPASYWRDHGYRLRTGVAVTVNGWGEGDDYGDGPFYAASIGGDGFFFELSNSEGFPLWCDNDEWYDGWCPTPDFYYQVYCNWPAYVYCPPAPIYYWGGRPFFHHRPYYNRHFYGGRGWRGGSHGWRGGERHGGGHRGGYNGGGNHGGGGGYHGGGNNGGGGGYHGGGNNGGGGHGGRTHDSGGRGNSRGGARAR